MTSYRTPPAVLVKTVLISSVLVLLAPAVALGDTAAMEKTGTPPYVTHYIWKRSAPLRT